MWPIDAMLLNHRLGYRKIF